MRAVRIVERHHALQRAALALALAVAVVVTVPAPALAVPPVVDAADDTNVDEGTPGFNAEVASFSDGDLGGSFTADVDWGDGTTDDCTASPNCTVNDAGGGNGTVDGIHEYADDGVFTVTITVDEGADTSNDTFQMTVDNVAPTIALSGGATVNEGTSYALTLGAITDPGDDTVTQYQVDWDDGSAVENFATGGVKNHTYTDNAAPTISVALVDEDGTHAAAGTLGLTVNNVNPTVTAPATASITEGDTLSSSITFTDPGSSDTHERRVRYGTAEAFGAWGTVTSPFNLSNVYTDDATDTVTIQVRDDDLGQGSDTIALTVNNANPVVTARGDTTVENGEAVFLGSSAFTDAGTVDTHTATVDWDDGSPVAPITVTQGAGSGTLSGNHTYAANGTYTVILEVTDDDGGVHSDTFDVTVANSPFTVNAGGNQNIDEGDTSNVSATFNDTDGAGTHTATINWGDGTTDDCSTPACTIFDGGAGIGTVSGSHVYADNDGSPYTVTVTVDDETGDTANDSLNVTVNNVDPVVTLSGAGSVDEGSDYSLTISGVTDPGDDTVTEWIVDWDDGSAPETFIAGGVHTHAYVDGTINPTISIDLVDEDGTYTNVDTLAITVNNIAPTITLTGPASVDEGAMYTLTLGAVTDPGDDTATEYIIDWDDGSGPQSVFTLGDVTHTYADGPDSPTISVSVVDEDSTHAAAGTLGTTVNNVAPTLTAPATATITEGDTLASLISFADPGADTHEVRINYGEGAGFSGWGTETSPFNLNNLFEEDSAAGTYTVTIEVRDSDLDVDTATIDVTVDNANPVVTARGDDTTADGGTVFIGGGGGTSFTDAGVLDTHTATIDWDDGDGPETATVNAGTITFAGGHTYATPGTYTVTVEVTDDDGGIGSDTFTVNVTNALFDVTATPTPAVPVIDEGDSISVATVFDDLDGAGNHTATIEWAPGEIDDCSTAACTIIDNGDGTGTVSGSHTYAQDGSFTVTVTVEDQTGDVGTDGFTTTVNNVAPTTAVSGPTSADEGDSIGLFGNPSDPGVDDVLTYAWEITKDGDPFKSGTNRNISFTPDDNGEYVASYTVTDDDESSATEEHTVTVDNVDPTTAIVDEATGNPITGITDIGVEGSTITLRADIVDPGSADTFTYDWAIVQPGSPPITGTDSTISFVSPDDGLFFVNLTVADDDGGEDTPSSPIINVINGEPVILSLVTDATPAVGATVNLGINFEDPGSSDTHLITIDWGDGDNDTIPNASSPEAATHSYPTAGARNAELCIVDDDGGETCAAWYYNVGASLERTADYDGDGREDLAVGVAGEDAGGGGVHVVYGSNSGLNGVGDQFLQQGVNEMVGSLEDGDGFGATLAHGDFNGDGFTDLAIGAPGEDMSGFTDVGNVTVIYGSASGLDLGTDQTWHQDKSGVPDANEAGDGWGQALVSGDFNGDAFADLAIGAPFENVGGVADAGRTTVLFGSPTGLTAAGSVFLDQDVEGIANSNQANDHLGAALAAGDFNGDGFDDIGMGVPGQIVGGEARAGAVSVVFGGLVGFEIDADLFLHQQTGGVLNDPDAGDEFGSVLDSGDLNGDGFSDLVVGIPSEAVSGKFDAGAVAVLPGSGAGPSGDGDALFREGGTMLGNAIKKDAFGASVAVGDVNGDGVDDLLVGIPNQKISGQIQAGAVAFIPGSANLGTAGNSRWHEDKTNIVGTAQKADHLGAAVAIVDTNGDGFADIALGIPDQNRQGRKDVGAVLVIRGGANGPIKTGDGFFWQGENGLADNTQKFDRFGGAL